ncbi:MAG: LPXTG cell wall anchor domain-containing protein [Actinomycetota bacterium]|nr:LPXTG cell wall anchor domain-containing protein [Actinomycetota bacterium]
MTDELRSDAMSALVAGLALATALSQRAAPTALVSSPIVCAKNADISQSGCGHDAGSPGASGFGQQDSPGASGFHNVRSPGASGSNNVDSPGASGCNNVSSAGASGNGHVNSPGASGGPPCSSSTPPPTPPPTICIDSCTTVTTGGGSSTTLGVALPVNGAVVATLPLTGRDSTAPLTLAVGLMLSGAAAVGLANRRRHALAAVNGGELIPLSAAVGLLLTGRAKSPEPQDQPKS